MDSKVFIKCWQYIAYCLSLTLVVCIKDFNPYLSEINIYFDITVLSFQYKNKYPPFYKCVVNHKQYMLSTLVTGINYFYIVFNGCIGL